MSYRKLLAEFDCQSNVIVPGFSGILSIQFAAPGKRYRKVVKRSNARNTNKYPSWKMGRMMQCESANERDAMILLDACSWVKAFREQPCEIKYVLNGKTQRHVPDILVIGDGWQSLWEIKPRWYAEQADIAERTAFLNRELPNHGYRYQLVLAEDLMLDPRISNAKLLLSMGRAPVALYEREVIRRLFATSDTLPWGIFKSNPEIPQLLQQACRLVLEGNLYLDVNQPISDDTMVTWVSKPSINGGASWESLISSRAH